jgi:acetylornithine deacetylase/succinyl-diaminopimelate desuccinylase-like protein
MNEEAAALAGRIDGRRMRELLVDFANVQGSGDRPHVAAEWFAGLLRASGAVEARVYRRGMAGPAVAAGFPGLNRAPTLQFMGYFAAPGPASRKAYSAGGDVHGRAAASTAAGLIAAVEAARILAAHGPMPGGGLLFTAHPADSRAQTAADIGLLTDMGVVGQAVVITSGDSSVIPVAGQGTCQFEVEFLLPTTGAIATDAHSTVIDAAHIFYKALKRKRAEAAYAVDALTGPDIIVVGRMGGGEGYDSPPSSSWLQGVWRYGPSRTAEMVREELNLIAQRIAAASGTLVKLSLNVLRPPYCLDPAAPLVQTLQRGCREVWGRDLPKGRATYPSDVPLFLARGVPAICHAPRPGSHSAGDEECVSMEDVSRLAEVYLRLSLAYLSSSGEAANSLAAKTRLEERAMVYSTRGEPELVTQGSIA